MVKIFLKPTLISMFIHVYCGKQNILKQKSESKNHSAGESLDILNTPNFQILFT